MKAKRFSFLKSRHLTRPAEFERVKKSGQVQHGRLLTLSTLHAEADRYRAGFITSRKIGGAVIRNRVRRRLREIIRKYQADIVDGTWVITIARTAAARAEYKELEGEWLRLARRASILAP